MADFEQYQNLFNKDHSSIILPPPLNNPVNNLLQQQKSVLLPPPNVNATSIWDYKFNPYNNLYHQSSNDQLNSQQQQQLIQQLRSFPQNPINNFSQSNSVLTPAPSSDGKSYNTSPSPMIPNFNNDQMLQTTSVPVLPPLNNNRTSPIPSPISNVTSSYPTPLNLSSSGRSSSLNSIIPQQRSSSSSQSISISKPSKPRKKKQCPECHLFFSNLSTHKSTHLNPSSRPFQCQICGRGFSRSNDLFRHSKRHWKETGSSQGAFKCPFSTILLKQYDPSIQIPESDVPCHSSGIFSRCDTYKNHLKALHFEYPPGTKKKNRNGTGGTCKKCGNYFQSVDEWLATHVNTNDCGFKFE